MATILIVEDDGIIAAHLDSLLTAEGHTVLPPVSSGEEAIAAAVACPPDLILMDIQLAGELDGIAAAAQIQSTQDVPVVYLTAYTQDARLQQAKATRPYAYLAKPVSSRELIATLDTVLYRHALDRRLKESEERYRRIVETAAEGIWMIDSAGVTTFVNRRMAEMLGCSVEEMLGQPADFLAPDTRPHLTQRLERQRQGLADRFERRLRRKGGGECWMYVSATPIFDAKGGTIGSLAMFTDITARKEIEAERDAAVAALRQREGYLTAIIESLPGTAWLKDVEGRFLVVNHACAAFHHVTAPDDIVGRLDREVLRPDLADRFRAQDVDVMASGQTATFHERIEDDAGVVRWFEARKTPIRDGAAAIVGTAGYSHDITTLRQAAEERLDVERRLLHAQKMESLAVLAGAIAHDFKNVLQSVIGHLDLALLDPALSLETAEHLATAGRSAHRAVELVQQLLTYAGRGKLQLQAVDLSRLLDDNRTALQGVTGDHVTLELRLAPDLPPIEADAGRLRQALMNLVTNAVDAIGDTAGHITLTTGVRDCDEAYLRQSRLADRPPAGRYVYLEVSDTGCGMDAAALQQIFDPFYTTKLAGRGLGLPAVLGIVRGHHGAIIVRSRVRHGTTVRLLFPLGHPAAVAPLPAAIEAHMSSPVPRSSRDMVMVVDDDDNVRRVASEYLRRRGFEVLSACDGEVALSLCQEHTDRLACVVLDLTMPGLDGVEVFERLHQLHADVPVILSSGYSEDVARARFAGQQPVDFLEKPYRMEMLRDTIERALRAEQA